MHLINKHVDSLLETLMPSSDCVLLASLAIVKISGNKAGEFLQGQLTCDIAEVTESQGKLAAICNPQGRVLVVAIVVTFVDDYYLILPIDLVEFTVSHLSKFAVFSKVVVEQQKEANYLYGFIGESYTTEFKNFATGNFAVHHQSEKLVISVPGIKQRYLMWSFKAIEKAHNTEASWWLLSILSGQATIYAATSGKVTPHMLDLPSLGAVSFNKGCYVGQEIIARTQYLGKSKRHLRIAKVDVLLNHLPGELIFVNQQEAGLLINLVGYEGSTFMLVVLQEPLDRQFKLGDVELELLDCEGEAIS